MRKHFVHLFPLTYMQFWLKYLITDLDLLLDIFYNLNALKLYKVSTKLRLRLRCATERINLKLSGINTTNLLLLLLRLCLKL